MFQKRVLLFSVMPFLFASKCKGRNKDNDQDQTEIVDVIRPESKLQVLGIDPDTMAANTAFPANITGAGFQEGATVMLGVEALLDAEWLSANQLSISVPELQPGDYDIEVQNPNGQNHVLRSGLWIQDPSEIENDALQCEDFTVYFELDKSSLQADSQTLIEEKRECLNQANVRIRVEGHCDERGTTEYNIALGQRRADAVQRYLVGTGVVPSSIETVSYGEERPAVRGATPEAWQQNRRAEIIFAN